MKIEEEIFQKSEVKEESLIPYGFVKEKDDYRYSKKFMKNTFQADIFLDKKGKVTGKVYDLEVGEEYTNFRLESMVGEFVSTVKEEYHLILKDILKHCFQKNYFQNDQSNRLVHFIQEKYQVLPEFLWDKFPDYAIFRVKRTGKWFGALMTIDQRKIGIEEPGNIEVLNVKVEGQGEDYWKRKGFYPAYHFNKKSWVTIPLDNTLTDAEIFQLIDDSYQSASEKKEWVIPANPKYYNVIKAFEQSDTILWKQSLSMLVGDMVYIYFTAPYCAILFQCQIIETNIPSLQEEGKMQYEMKLKKIKQYSKDDFPREKLKAYGLTSVRSARGISKALSKELQKDTLV